MQTIVAVILLALLQYWIFTLLVARFRNKVLAPAMTGPPEFERALRTQLNTAEHLIIFLPTVWLFGAIVSVTWGTVLGVVYLAGRTLYAIGYAKSPSKRRLGSILTFAAELALLIGALVGLYINWSLLS